MIDSMSNQVRTILWWLAASTFLGLSVGLLSGMSAYGWGIFYGALAVGMFLKTTLVYLHGPSYTSPRTAFLDAVDEERGGE